MLLILLGLAVLGELGPVSAAPFAERFRFTQPEGQRIVLWGEGDEFQAVFETLDGYTAVFDPASRAYHYAQRSADGEALEATGLVVGQTDPAAAGLAKHARLNPDAARRQALERRRQLDLATGDSARWARLKADAAAREEAAAREGPQSFPPNYTTLGVKVGLCLLVDFDDDPATVPQADVANFLNGDNYTGNGNNGSVKQYFGDVSGGRLTFSNVVTVYVRIPNSLHPKSYYNDPTKDTVTQAELLIRDAITVMKARADYATVIFPQFAALTTEWGNYVMAFSLFFAGNNSGVWRKGLWPSRYFLTGTLPELSPGGNVVYNYQITDLGAQLKLSTFCHETGHMLCGFPDLYDYDQDSSGGAGVWCLMNTGSFAYNPAQFCAYLKTAAGWATLTDLDLNSALTATVSAGAGTNFNHFYRWRKPGVTTEYFLVENRQRAGRDALTAGAGVALWHIDELGDRDDQRMAPNTNHQNFEVTLVTADNLWHFQNHVNGGDTNDLFYLGNSAAAYANVFSDDSTPAARWWDGSRSGLYFRDFSTNGETMTFQVVPVPLAPVLDRQPQDQTVVAGASATFSVIASGTPPLRYQWRRNNSDLADATNASYTISNVQSNLAGNYVVVVSNGYGAVTSQVAVLSVVPTLSIGEAVDAPAWGWTTGGDSPWTGVTNVTHDGVDAAASGALEDDQTNWIQTTVTGPGTLQYWWKVSSETSYDWLEFLLDGVVQARRLSGEVNWEQRTHSLAAGTHTLRWRYVKDIVGTSGQDRGWVDQVSFVAAQPPVITSQPQSLTVNAGGSASFSVTASGTSPLTYQWLKAGITLGGATNALYSIAVVQPSHAGQYWVVVSNAYGRATSQAAVLTVTEPPTITQQPRSLMVSRGATATFDVVATGTPPLSYQWLKEGAAVGLATNATWSIPNVETNHAGQYQVIVSNAYGRATSQVAVLTVGTLELGEAVDAPAWGWTTGGDSAWTGVTNVTHDGVDAAASGPLAHDQTNWIQTTVTGPGTLQYWWKVSSETNYDWLEFLLDGVVQARRLSGEANWEQRTHSLAAGTHTLRWRYVKDIVGVSGQDRGWVDQVSFVAAQPPAITSQPQSLTVNAGGSASFSVTASGTSPLTYQWLKEGIALGGATNMLYSLAVVQPSHAGQYWVVVSNAYGRATSQVAVLTVTVPPTITQQPRSLMVSRGATATFDVVATGTSPLSYQWLKEGAAVGLATNATWSIPNVETNHAGQYQVIVSNAYGCATSQVAVLTVGTLDVVGLGTWPGYFRGPVNDVKIAGVLAYLALGRGGLALYDVSNPTAPTPLGGVDTSGSATDIAVGEAYAYVADGVAGIQIVAITNPACPRWVGSYDTPGSAESVQVVGSQAFVADGPTGLLILDVSNPANPQAVGTNDTTGYAYRVYVAGNYAYVADYNTGLQVINISNPSAPARVGGYDTLGTAQGVTVAGAYAYVADYDYGLQIIQVSNPASPQLAGTYNTIGYAGDVEVAGTNAYVADNVSGVQVINVSSPASPARTGGTTTLGAALRVEVASNWLYVAEGTGGLQVFSLTNPINPSLAGGFQLNGSANRVRTADNYAYLADDAVGLQVVDVRNPFNPQRVGGYDTSGTARDLCVVSNWVYVADDSAGLQIISVSNPASPQRLGGYDTTGYAYGVDVVSNLAYVADYSAGLQIISVSNPANPQRLGGYDTSGSAYGVKVVGRYAYVADGSSGLQIIDVANPASPQFKGVYNTSGSGYAVDVAGNYAYVADGYSGLQIINVTSATSPALVATLDTIGVARHVNVSGNYAFVADDTNGLRIIDISDPANPRSLGGYMPPGTALGVHVAGDRVYVAAESGGLAIISLTGTPTQPPQISLHPQSLSVNRGGRALFEVTAEGTAPLSYQWQKDNAALLEATQATCVITGVLAQHAGQYNVVVSNAGGAVTSQVAVLTVLGPPQFTLAGTGLGLTNGQFRLRLANLGRTSRLVIEAATNGLAHWQPVYTNPAPGGAVDFTEPVLPQRPIRYFRAWLEP